MSLDPARPFFSAEPVDWSVAVDRVAYPLALAQMEAQVGAIAQGGARERVWLLEHPPLYTAGTSAQPGDLLEPDRFEVFAAGRGGRHTYHGPGQRVAYVMLDLVRRKRDVRGFVHALEQWIIDALAAFDIRGERRADRVGVWVALADGSEAKIAALGVRLRRWVSFHGVSINVDPDLSHFAGIVPCGIAEHGVTSMRALGSSAGLADVDAALRSGFEQAFGPTRALAPVDIDLAQPIGGGPCGE